MNCSPLMEMMEEQEKLKRLFPQASESTLKRNPVFAASFPSHRPPGYSVPQLAMMDAGSARVKKPSKYRNIKVEHNGLKFDSKKELQCWLSLLLRQKLGEISELERQVVFPLVVNSRSVGRFTADFTWVENGQPVVADTKSPPTRKETAYRLRKKIFEALFFPLVIREL